MKCSFCDREAVYFRKYEGHYYCKGHFVKNIEKKVRRTKNRNKLIEDGDRVAIALSGGKDSSNTLFIINKLFKDHPKVEFFALTLDEGIKGYRDKCVKKSKVLCKELGVEQFIFSFKKEFGFTIDELAERLETGFCGACGLLRRYLLNKKARELGATKLATGHNLDDECQSIIMNFLKGDFLRLARVGPMPHLAKHPRFVVRIKPLIQVPEEESILYNKIRKISSCPKKCPYSFDNPLRGKTREFLKSLEETSPGIRYSLYESALKLASLVKEEFKSEKIKSCKECGEPSSREICKVCEFLKSIKS